MFYTPEEKAKMDTLLAAFQPYVDQLEDYDVVYSEKAGYILLSTGSSSDHTYYPITDFAHMMRMFTDDFLLDEETRVNHYLKLDYNHVRSLLTPILDTLGDLREEAHHIMEQAFDARRTRNEQIRQNYLDEIRQYEKLIDFLRKAI